MNKYQIKFYTQFENTFNPKNKDYMKFKVLRNLLILRNNLTFPCVSDNKIMRIKWF